MMLCILHQHAPQALPTSSRKMAARYLQTLGDGVEIDVRRVEGDNLAGLVGHGGLLNGWATVGTALSSLALGPGCYS